MNDTVLHYQLSTLNTLNDIPSTGFSGFDSASKICKNYLKRVLTYLEYFYIASPGNLPKGAYKIENGTKTAKIIKVVKTQLRNAKDKKYVHRQ